MQSEIDLQRKVSQEFSKNVQEARTEINRKAEGYKALAKAAEDKAAQALQNGDLNAYREAVQTANEHHQKADNWQKGGVALAAVATGLSAPTDSALGIAAATASPAAAYQIGQYFKELAQQNSDGKLTAKQETAHILAHAVLGAATAAAGDNNALAGTISAGSAEAAAPLIGNYLYGEKDGSKLTAEQKETVTAITNLLGTATGAAVGNTTANAAQGSLVAGSAVENNYYLTSNALNKKPEEVRNIYKVLKNKVIKECNGGRIQECRQDIERIINFAQDSRFAQNHKDLQNESMQFLSQHQTLLVDYLTARYETLSREDKSILNRYITPGAEIVAGASGIVISVKGGVATCPQSFGLTCSAAAVGLFSSTDHLATGLNNFGKKASEQSPTITVQELKKLGLSEQAADYVQLAIDTLSVGKAATGIPKPKPIPKMTMLSTSGGTANAATGPKLVQELKKEQALDARIGSTLANARAPITVTAESNIGGRFIFDTNQTARPKHLADSNKPTLIADLIPPGKPNSNMGNAHAEIGVIQQAYDAKLTKGQNMTIIVRGEEICTYCRNATNLISAADRAGLNSLKVIDTVSDRTYIWERGTKGWK
ncbi:VENN motif pre-toxin domain-containing protein [Neisseria yangbaofengii]|uniref:VENN motif pre-toxin domain-containing protein n=2 Tax=Neisseria yangbaofengii TaxID=2709396 RepID=UPI003BA0A7BA